MLTITLLGTAATMPLPDRALSTAFAPGLKGEGGDARMNGLLGGGEDHFRHFAFRFAKVFQSGLDFFQHVH